MPRFSALVFVLAASTLVFCGKKEASDKIAVVVTITPLADFVRGAGGERVEVTTLLSPGASPHTFEPAPSQALAASKARLAVRVGLGLDDWVDGLLPRTITTVTAGGIRGIELIADEEGHADHEHSGYNPHIWLDPVYAKSIVSTIADSLIKIDPGNRTLYERNRDTYISRLDSLDARIRNKVSSFSLKGYVEFHPAWVYFGRRYGLKELAVIESSPGKEPTPRHLEEVVAAIKSSGTRVLFAEPQLSPKAAEVIAREAGVEVLVLDPLGRQGEGYVGLMNRNLEVLTRALGPR